MEAEMEHRETSARSTSGKAWNVEVKKTHKVNDKDLRDIPGFEDLKIIMGNPYAGVSVDCPTHCVGQSQNFVLKTCTYVGKSTFHVN
jgi:hypothetical protein